MPWLSLSGRRCLLLHLTPLARVHRMVAADPLFPKALFSEQALYYSYYKEMNAAFAAHPTAPLRGFCTGIGGLLWNVGKRSASVRV